MSKCRRCELITNDPPPDKGALRLLSWLSDRRARICALVADGVHNPEIARIEGTSTQVVKNYLRQIMAQSGVENRVQLALLVERNPTLREHMAKVRAAL